MGATSTKYRAQRAVGPADAVWRIKDVRNATGAGLYEACDALHQAGWSVTAATAWLLVAGVGDAAGRT